MIKEEQVEKESIQLTKALASISDDILRRFPVRDYLNDVKSYTGFGRLSYFSRKRKRIRVFEKIKSQYDAPALPLYLKLALCCFISDSLGRLSREDLPGDILRLYHEWFERVLEDFSTQPDDYYDYRSVSFALDVRVCSLRNIPVGGAWVVETRGVGLRPFIGGGVRQFFYYLQFVILKTGGFTRYFTPHAAPRYLRYFNRQQMNLSYLRIAALMKLDPRIRGIYRRSWFLDPNLEQISPNLGYFRQVALQNGAKMFAAGSTKSDIKYALAMSSTRRRLHAQGQYLPTGYAYIWPRKEFLEWANRADVRALIESGGTEPGIA
jgi:hypothetical protein